MSRITALRTIRISERPNLIWVELDTDEGLCGLGESFRGAQAVEAVLHEQVAPWLIGRDARQIEAVSRYLMTHTSVSAAQVLRCGPPAPSTSRSGTSPASAMVFRSTRPWVAQCAHRSGPTTPAQGTPTTPPGSPGAISRRATRRLAPTTIRS